MSQYQKGKTNQDFTEARDSEWQWHQLGHTQMIARPSPSQGAPRQRPKNTTANSRATVLFSSQRHCNQ